MFYWRSTFLFLFIFKILFINITYFYIYWNPYYPTRNRALRAVLDVVRGEVFLEWCHLLVKKSQEYHLFISFIFLKKLFIYISFYFKKAYFVLLENIYFRSVFTHLTHWTVLGSCGCALDWLIISIKLKLKNKINSLKINTKYFINSWMLVRKVSSHLLYWLNLYSITSIKAYQNTIYLLKTHFF